MPLAQFTEAKLLEGSTLLAVVGTYLPGPLEHGAIEHPLAHFHYAIIQGRVMVRGSSTDIPVGDWTGVSPAADLREGSALAAGVGLIFREVPTPAFESFTWSQEIAVTTG